MTVIAKQLGANAWQGRPHCGPGFNDNGQEASGFHASPLPSRFIKSAAPRAACDNI